MQASRLLISALTAIGVVGAVGLAVAQTNTATDPAAATVTTPGGSATVTAPSVTTRSETEVERMDRERMDRERIARESMNTPTATDRMDTRNDRNTMGDTARRDANGDLVARADRN